MDFKLLGENELQEFKQLERLLTAPEMQVSDLWHSYGYNIYVAITEGEWIGYLVVHELEHSVWDLIHIAIMPQFQNNNVASEMFLYFYMSKTVKMVTLEVDEANEQALNFYNKHGFSIVSRRKNYYGTRDGILMMKETKYILSIETSCDETAAAVVQSDYKILSNIIHTQAIHEQYGGVVPEIASREHVEKLPQIIEQAIDCAKITYADLDYIAVTTGPGLAGSLMIGVEAAKTLAWQLDIPIIPINHMAGHIYANYDEGALQFPLLSVIVSGGHTEIVEVNDKSEFIIHSQTHDDAVGEVYDKVARVLGLGYPGGPKIAKLAEKGKVTYDFPIAKVRDDEMGMSFSGLKTAVINFVHNQRQKEEVINEVDIAASFQHAVIRTLVEKVNHCLQQKKYSQIVLAGGVSANTEIRRAIKELANKYEIIFSVPKMELCTDNAAMIGLAACVTLEQNKVQTGEQIRIEPSVTLGQEVK